MIGNGVLKTAWVANKTAIIRARANNPLKLLCPRSSDAARVYLTTYGGGLVAGDHIHLDVEIAAKTSCLLTSQASTKVYKCCAGKIARQAINASVGDGALLAIVPDPITLFANAHFQQDQTIHVAPGGNLVFVDWLTSGRRARNECWAFAHYHSRTKILIGDKCVFLDSLRLDPADGPLDSPYRLGQFHCLGLLVIIGPHYKDHIGKILADVGGQPISIGSPIIETASEISGGVVLRIIGMETEIVGRVLKKRLEFLANRLGSGPWARKW